MITSWLGQQVGSVTGMLDSAVAHSILGLSPLHATRTDVKTRSRGCCHEACVIDVIERYLWLKRCDCVALQAGSIYWGR